jgi:hypothetical protein
VGEYRRSSGLSEDGGRNNTLQIPESIEKLYKEHQKDISEGGSQKKWIFGRFIDYHLLMFFDMDSNFRL